MDPNVNGIAINVLADMIERFGFMFADLAENGEIIPPEDGSLLAEMAFSGVLSGTLSLLVGDDLALELTANIMGLETDDDTIPGRVPDAIKELLNLVCGHLLNDLTGDAEVFDLSIPVVSRSSPEVWRATLGRPQTICLKVEDRPVLLQIQIEGRLS